MSSSLKWLFLITILFTSCSDNKKTEYIGFASEVKELQAHKNISGFLYNNDYAVSVVIIATKPL